MFFKNYVEKKSPEKCPDNDGHNVDAIDALMTVPVTTIAMIDKDRDARLEAVKNAIQVTRRTTGSHSFSHSITHSLPYLLSHLLTYLLTHSLTHLLTYSLTHLLTHSLTCLRYSRA